MEDIKIFRPKDEYIVEYPEAVEFAKQQAEIFWLPDEIEMSKDLHDLKVNMTEAELHGVTTVLKLFTKYETDIGQEYWGGRVKRIFKRPADIGRMAATFAFFEMGVHAPFYNKINEQLGLNTEAFYRSYNENPILKDRIDWLNELIGIPIDNEMDILKSLGTFSFVEGAVLYSSFAFLKHFQSEGKNLLSNLVAGINFSVKDENPLIKGTEVLTTNGWKKIEDVKLHERIMQYDLDTKELNFTFPIDSTNHIPEYYYSFKSDDFSQIVSPKHRMVTTDGIVRADDTTGEESYIVSGMKVGGRKMNEEDVRGLHLTLAEILNGHYSVDWIYDHMLFISSDFAKHAVDYYIDNKNNITLPEDKQQEIADVFDLLANIAGGKIKQGKFVKVVSTQVTKSRLENTDKNEFYCLTVPTGAFVVRHNGKISITGNCHAEAGAWLFRTILRELNGKFPKKQREILQEQMYHVAQKTYEHEAEIIKMIFSGGNIKGITELQLDNFVQSRIDLCLENLGYEPLFKPEYNPIKTWFYKSISGTSILHDFFAGQGSSYSRDWREKDFIWKTKQDGNNVGNDNT